MPATCYGAHTSKALGTFATLLVADPAALEEARGLLDAELAAIDAACSRFRPESELRRACAAGGRPVPVEPAVRGGPFRGTGRGPPYRRGRGPNLRAGTGEPRLRPGFRQRSGGIPVFSRALLCPGAGGAGSYSTPAGAR